MKLYFHIQRKQQLQITAQATFPPSSTITTKKKELMWNGYWEFGLRVCVYVHEQVLIRTSMCWWSKYYTRNKERKRAGKNNCNFLFFPSVIEYEFVVRYCVWPVLLLLLLLWTPSHILTQWHCFCGTIFFLTSSFYHEQAQQTHFSNEFQQQMM